MIRFECAVRVGPLISGAVIGAGVEMAGGASGVAVASDLHVPEEGFAQYDQDLRIADISIEIGDRRHADCLE
jgi:hypothetical protein